VVLDVAAWAPTVDLPPSALTLIIDGVDAQVVREGEPVVV